MTVSEALHLLGGVATRAQLVDATSRAEVDRALATGEVVARSRGRYTSPQATGALAEAHRLSGTVVLLSAALLHGWAVLKEPALPQVAVPRNRRLRTRPAGVELFGLDLEADDVRDGVSTQERTLLDCGRRLPDAEALAVFDSALRSGFDHRRLVRLADAARGRHVLRLRERARRADDRAANPFESGLRSIADAVPGLRVRPQVPVFADRFLGRPDLVDEDLRIVIEADSFEWHGGRSDLARDARRYNAFTVHGWLGAPFHLGRRDVPPRRRARRCCGRRWRCAGDGPSPDPRSRTYVDARARGARRAAERRAPCSATTTYVRLRRLRP